MTLKNETIEGMILANYEEINQKKRNGKILWIRNFLNNKMGYAPNEFNILKALKKAEYIVNKRKKEAIK